MGLYICDIFTEVAEFQLPAEMQGEIKLGTESITTPTSAIPTKVEPTGKGKPDTATPTVMPIWALINYDVRPYISKALDSLVNHKIQPDMVISLENDSEISEFIQYNTKMGLINIKELYLACPIANREPETSLKRHFHTYVKEPEAIILPEIAEVPQNHLAAIFGAIMAVKTFKKNLRTHTDCISKEFLETLTSIKENVTEVKVIFNNYRL